jgi:PIN domain nuclease of toxin-antitoxin system
MALYVTDTHPLVWYTSGKLSKLSAKALIAFQQADVAQTLIYIPAVVLWEIALLEKLGKIKLHDGFARWSSILLAKRGFTLLPLEPSMIAQAVAYNFNNDSFDKMIVASAAEISVPLISKDVAIAESYLVEIWW